MNTEKRKSCPGRTWMSVLCLLAALGGLSSCEDLLTGQSGDPRDKLVDTWKVDETAVGIKKSSEGVNKSALEVYWVEISRHPYDSTRVLIDNFYNVEDQAEAILSGSALTLPQQTLEGGYTVRGTGQIQGTGSNEIIWTYRVDDGSGTEENYSAVYSRRTF